jgi:hypothetical protein
VRAAADDDVVKKEGSREGGDRVGVGIRLVDNGEGVVADRWGPHVRRE